MVQYAKFETKFAPLNEEFGLKLATQYFGQEVIDQLPRYVRGPKKGQIKAWLGWYKVAEGGWSRGMGGVLKPGVARAWITGAWQGEERHALRAEWLGGVQTLAGDRSLLSAEYRAQAIAERAKSKADTEEMYRDWAAAKAGATVELISSADWKAACANGDLEEMTRLVKTLGMVPA